ncbi:sorting nexin-13-like [Arctopsyche grandis]|uniref:sorting nexin-13-like n=1 Tax=Arctopsyche grandis TaxID=121162 RepID=UPI00406D6B57
MTSTGTKWTCAIVVLFLATFGVFGCLKIFIMIGLILSGGFTVVRLSLDGKKKYPSQADLLSNPLDQRYSSRPLRSTSSAYRVDLTQLKYKKITGHKEVDSFIIEIIDILIEDYVSSWYRTVAYDTHFPQAIKLAALDCATDVSNRLQSVDWLTHITGKLVDDMASHLRLFRVSGGGVPTSNLKQQRRRSPARSPARSTPHHRRNKSDTDVASYSEMPKFPTKTFIGGKAATNTLEQRFFEIEYELEKKVVSRKYISTDVSKKSVFIAELSQVILFSIVKSDELKNNATLCLLRALLCNVTTSLLDHIVNPDTLNTLILRMSSRDTLSTESFLTVLRTTDNVDELKATLAIVQKEIHNLASRDAGGECDIGVKQQLSSLQYLSRLLTNRTSMLAPPTPIRSTMFLTKMPLGFLLDNHLALCYFLDFAHSVSAHTYIFCYISIEAWHAAALKHLSEIGKSSTITDVNKSPSGVALRTAAFTIYDQYFSRKSMNYLDVPNAMLEKFHAKLSMPLNDTCLNWFDEIKKYIHSKLESVESAFRNSNQYTRLLAELDLEGTTPAIENPRFIDHRRTGSSGSNFYIPKPNIETSSEDTVMTEEFESKNEQVVAKLNMDSSLQSDVPKSSYLSPELPCRLEVVIVETGLMQERGKAYGVYALEVKRWDPTTGRQHCWHVYRRYSDFHELQTVIKEAYPELSKMEFPSKKTFHNTSRNVLERRMVTLSTWISALASMGSPGGPPRYAPLHLYLLPFLSPRGPQDKQQPTVINSIIVQPLRQGMRTLRNVPEQLANTVDDIMGGLSKLISTNKNISHNSLLYGQNYLGLENENVLDSEELPLRMLLLLLDEVFELRCRNRWLRRQIAAILRQILTTMFADVLNKKIIDAISSVTSPASIASYLDHFKRVYFTDTKTKEKKCEDRDIDSQARARVAAKTFLLSCRQDELKRLIGSQTTQKGLMTVFEMFQNQILNTRLIFVLIEGLIKVVFQEKDIAKVFQRMLNESPSSF